MNPSIPALLKNLSDSVVSGTSDWGSLHPFVVHFPIALLFIAPLFVVCGLIVQKSAKTFFTCALILMLLGSAGIFLAISTGDSAAERLEADPAIVSTLNTHVQLGERSRFIFSILSGFFLLFVAFHTALIKKFNRPAHAAAVCLFLMIYVLCLIILFNTAHYGGTLVHQHGISSSLYSR